MKIEYKKYKKIICAILIAILLYHLSYYVFGFMFGFPMPRGSKISPDYPTYYKNINGIYYISIDNVGGLITHGYWGYLSGSDPETFTVINRTWSKDKNHVWNGIDIIEGADAQSFTVDKYNLPKDKFHVFVRDLDGHYYRPSNSGIDVESAEGFADNNSNWMRDKDYVYLYETRLDVDRNTFEKLGHTRWWTDKDFIYADYWDSTIKKPMLTIVDSLRSPVDTIGCYYLRNGNNILYLNKVIAKNINKIKRIKQITQHKCIVNDMLFSNGRRILKDSLNVNEARFYLYGRLAVDNEHVFFDERLLDDIDAVSFRKIDAKTFEDKNYVYTVKDRWDDSNPFHRKSK